MRIPRQKIYSSIHKSSPVRYCGNGRFKIKRFSQLTLEERQYGLGDWFRSAKHIYTNNREAGKNIFASMKEGVSRTNRAARMKSAKSANDSAIAQRNRKKTTYNESIGHSDEAAALSEYNKARIEQKRTQDTLNQVLEESAANSGGGAAARNKAVRERAAGTTNTTSTGTTNTTSTGTTNTTSTGTTNTTGTGNTNTTSTGTTNTTGTGDTNIADNNLGFGSFMAGAAALGGGAFMVNGMIDKDK